MKALIVYDSVFGNTEKIAQGMREALSFMEKIDLVQVGNIKPEHLAGVELLIVGSPTRAFKPTPKIADFLKKISSNDLKMIKVAAFDTRISKDDTKSRVFNVLEKFFGYAAKPIADKLVKKGGTLVIQPEGFIVVASEGPLKDGEIERAKNWVKSIITV